MTVRHFSEKTNSKVEMKKFDNFFSRKFPQNGLKLSNSIKNSFSRNKTNLARNALHSKFVINKFITNNKQKSIRENIFTLSPNKIL